MGNKDEEPNNVLNRRETQGQSGSGDPDELVSHPASVRIQVTGSKHTIPERRDHYERRQRRAEDPPDFDAALYRKRN
jgi:hypothetical protein